MTNGIRGCAISSSQQVGRGTCSEVFAAVNIETDQRHIIKGLKPVRNNKIVHEINILKTFANGPNIIALTGVVKEQDTRNTCLIFGPVCNKDCQHPPEGMRPHEGPMGSRHRGCLFIKGQI